MWIPLHLHSQYSILDATTPIDQIAIKAAAMKMEACALTDHGNLFGMIDFYKACKASSIKPILGCELYIAPKSRFEKKKTEKKSAYHLVLLAKDEIGFQNLSLLSSLGYLEGFYYHPRIDKELLAQHKEGLICLSACLSGSVAQLALEGAKEELYKEIEWYRDLFGEDYYIEIQRHQMSPEELSSIDDETFLLLYREMIEKQKRVNGSLIEAASHFKIKCVATNDTHYLEKEDWLAHEILINVQSGDTIEIVEKDANGNPQFRHSNPKRRIYATRELYFKSPEEMATLFSDLPEALSSTLEIAAKCNVKIDFEKKHYPLFVPPSLTEKKYKKKERTEEVEKYLRQLCEEAIPKRYSDAIIQKVAAKFPGKEPMEVVKERLDYELEIISSKELGDYLLIVWDIINWAKGQKIPVGPGRGSGAGSIILYLIGITDIEPLSLHLFFERFINPERLSYPDIDVDVCMEGRGRVIDYVVSRYGKESVAQIITFGTMKAKSAIRDVGRVLSIPLPKVNIIAKRVPDDLSLDLGSSIEMEGDLKAIYQEDPEAKRVLDLALKLEGSIRNLGIHAAGLIIAPGQLTDYIPVCLAKDSEIVATQYSMKPVEAVGMLKVDILGLKTLTALKIANDAVNESKNSALDWRNLPLDDKNTYQLLQTGKTLGIFQLESSGIQELAKQLKPDSFEDIMAIVALYRPGPLEMIPSFIARKHKREPIEYDHPLLEPILKETHGIMVYQEQVMHIAQELAGYSLGEGDVLRKAMGKKDHVQMKKERAKFCKGAVLKGIDRDLAEKIFDKMEKFASYGFNKSHAAAYAYLAFATAYLKAYYPMEWMAAVMTCDRDDIEKVAKWIREALDLSIPILPPDINESGSIFLATPHGIRFAMTAIKGIGEGVVEHILQERRKGGPFSSFFDFFNRIDLGKIGKKSVENLVFAGAFDGTKWSRDQLFSVIDEMHEVVSQTQKEKAAGILSLFALTGDHEVKSRFQNPPKVVEPTPKKELLKKEKELLGFYLTGHPMEEYLKNSTRLGIISFSDIEKMEHGAAARLAFIVEAVEVKFSIKSQRKFAILTISDGIVRYPLFVFFDLYEQKGALLEENRLLYAVVSVDKREEAIRLTAIWIDDLTKADEKMIDACDRAFDRVKMRSSFPSPRPKESQPATALGAPKEPLRLRVELTLFHMSDILKLKELFRNHLGPTPVHIEFVSEAKSHSTLFIDASRGVTIDNSFAEKMAQLKGIELV